MPQKHWLAVTAGEHFSVFSKSPIIPFAVLLVTSLCGGKPSQFLFALVVYCKLLLWKYSHRFACATVHVIAFWQECKKNPTTFILQIKSKRCFYKKMTFSAWLLVEISFVLVKLTSWQSCHLSFSSHKIGTKQMLLGFFWQGTFFRRVTCKDKVKSLVNLSHSAVSMLLYLSNPINWVICKYIPKGTVAIVMGRWIRGSFQTNVRKLAEGLLSASTYQ